MNNQQYTQPEFKPSSGHIVYTRWMGANYIVSGEVIGEREIEVRRHKAFITEYLVKPAVGVTNLSRHIVDESNVVKIEKCQRCHDQGYLSIRNGCDDQPCPICGETDDSEVF